MAWLKTNWFKIRHYLISSIITFLTGFVASFLLLIDKFDLQSLETGAWIGFLFAAVRAGVKALLEEYLEHKLKK